jgi:hypothetical protein
MQQKILLFVLLKLYGKLCIWCFIFVINDLSHYKLGKLMIWYCLLILLNNLSEHQSQCHNVKRVLIEWGALINFLFWFLLLMSFKHLLSQISHSLFFWRWPSLCCKTWLSIHLFWFIVVIIGYIPLTRLNVVAGI